MTTATTPLTIAIDGPSGSRKSSVSKAVAGRLGIGYLDTGAMYRALTWWCVEQGIDLADHPAVALAASDMPLELSTDPEDQRVVVGGTDDEGEWDRRVDADVATRILARATELVPELAGARVVGHRVGLRPVRPQVRLEVEQPAGGSTRVVHCYGHGGAGVTLSWGCADEVARLVSEL